MDKNENLVWSCGGADCRLELVTHLCSLLGVGCHFEAHSLAAHYVAILGFSEPEVTKSGWEGGAVRNTLIRTDWEPCSFWITRQPRPDSHPAFSIIFNEGSSESSDRRTSLSHAWSFMFISHTILSFTPLTHDTHHHPGLSIHTSCSHQPGTSTSNIAATRLHR